MLFLLAVLVLTFAVWEIFVFYRRRSSLPPGPFPVPFLGNFINEIKPPYTYLGLRRISAKYGKVSTVHMPMPVVNIADYETMRDAYRSPDITGRMRNILIETTRLLENGGIISSDGADWMEQRRFAIGTLRDFGMGKNLMEEKVRLSAKNMVEFIASKDLNDADLRWPIQVFVSNIINEFLFGFQFPFDDCTPLMDFVLGLNDAITNISKSKVVMVVFNLPWIRHLPIIRNHWNENKERFQKMMDYVRVQARAIKYDPDEEPNCYVQAFYKNNKDQRFDQLVACCADLFLAGQETTTTTLRWGMLLLASNQDAQDKLRAEIKDHIESDRIAEMADKSKMPYTSAVINEIQRCANIVAPNPVLLHRATVDTEIAGHKIAANTLVNADIHQMMKTDPHFIDPERFNPERYLEDDGITLKKDLVDRTIPFGIGKRQCAGEGLARVELFIGLVTLIQNFRILPVPGKKINLEPIYANIHFPRPQNFRLEKI